MIEKKYIFLFPLFIISIGLAVPAIFSIQPTGKYSVGFDIIHQKNKQGMPILISTWYPASEGSEKMTWSDYIRLGSAEENKEPNKLLEEFKQTIAIKWILGLSIPEQTFDSSIHKHTYSNRGIAMAPGKFPLIIALSSPQSYIESFEFLASHGFVVVAVDGAFPNDTMMDQNPLFFVKYTDLLEELLDLMTSKNYINPNDISVFGHGFGIQPAMYLAMRNPKIKRVINFDGGFFGPRSRSTISIDYRPQNLHIPLLHIITREQESEDDKTLIKTLSNPITRVTIKPDFFKHHDLSSFGRFATHTAMVRGDKSDSINNIFSDIHQITLSFLLNKPIILKDTSTLFLENINH
ncbi:MAG: hypothetical protein ABI761_16590 [Saprospiraceae bacterium]